MAVSQGEKKIFIEFCMAMNLDPKDYDPLDAPDFVKKDRSIGIELVEYHSDWAEGGSKERQAEETFKTVVEIAQKRYSVGIVIKMNAYFLMGHLWTGVGFDFEKIASEIAFAVRENQGRIVNLDAYSLPELLRGIIDGILLHPVTDLVSQENWAYIAAVITDVIPKAVQATIDSKEKKVDAYKLKAKEAVLLIYSSKIPGIGKDIKPSTCGKITKKLEEAVFVTSFDRVHYLDGDSGSVIQLKNKSYPN